MMEAMLHDADWVKLNETELAELCPGSSDLERAMWAFCAQFDPEILVVTRGEQGVIACDRRRRLHGVKPQANVEVVDTVGAGDAFAAVLLMGFSRQWPLEMTLERAQAFASALVGRRGATVADRTFYEVFSQQWR